MNNIIRSTVENLIKEEREYGQYMFDYDDYYHDLRIMAECLDIDLVWNEDDEEWNFPSKELEEYTKEALEYYYKMKGI